MSDETPDAATQAKIRETLERMLRIAPELVRYIWQGEGDHTPLAEHALLGLTKTNVEWMKTVSEIPEPGWQDDGKMMLAVAEQMEAPEAVQKYIASQVQTYTVAKVRYWMQGVDGVRYVIYKLTVGGAGAEGQTRPTDG